MADHIVFEIGSVFGGMFLAEVSQHDFGLPSNVFCSTLLHKVRFVAVLILSSFGILVFSFTDANADFMTWTRVLHRLGQPYFPATQWAPFGDTKTYWPVIGAHLITIAVLLSPGIQSVLSHSRLVWLGSISYPFYLLHGMVIRTLLVWMLYGLREPIWLYTKDGNGNIEEAWQTIPKPDRWMYVPSLAVFLIVTLLLSHFWNQWIEPWFGWLTLKAEECMCPKLAEAQKREELIEEGLPIANDASLGERVPLMSEITQQ
ncbi:uncharacterized protein KY384_001149 [Bacidia gigantensis]|uniref:uncharacterized protein n=1 Tax=Bacidia gigantensis TaxID=2732470 RepID=UPI001D05349F|nr:uncharacterized protein KY384_001149 [Bacidia gigantensis]KAG8534305.1 hypothetical protein KY384_001149 [Bacidia gigantensis]